MDRGRLWRGFWLRVKRRGLLDWQDRRADFASAAAFVALTIEPAAAAAHGALKDTAHLWRLTFIGHFAKANRRAIAVAGTKAFVDRRRTRGKSNVWRMAHAGRFRAECGGVAKRHKSGGGEEQGK